MNVAHDAPFEPLRPLCGANEALARALHPADWRNPAPRPRYDLVVLGGGTAGLVTAAAAAGLGARVALVERELLGGDCLVTGCVPSKALLRAARAAHEARYAARFGVHTPDVRVDFGAVMGRLREARAALAPHDSAERFRGLGVDVFLGEGRFTSADMLTVDGAELRFKRACIAVGSEAAVPDIPGLAPLVAASKQGAGRVVTHTGVFSWHELPKRLAVLGGGPIGCELAQAFARLGSAVTLVEAGPRLLAKDHPDAGALLGATFQREGITVLDGCSARSIIEVNGTYELTLAGQAPRNLAVDAVLVAAGRRPRIAGLGLEAAGVAADPQRGIHVDDRLRTANPRIFAAGDCASPHKFTHMADAHARIVVRNALFHGRARVSRLVVPWVTYTDPEVAHTGLSLADAQREGYDAAATRVSLGGVDRARLDGQDEGFLEVVHTSSGRVLGGTLVAAHAGESLTALTLAIQHGVHLGELAAVIHPYPTVAEALRKAGDAFNRGRLTPRVARLLKWLARR